MSTVAEQLRQAREAQGLTVYQVAEITKIRTDHIRALDTGDYDMFSAPVYIRGFVRTYATLLKLDVQKVLADLAVELSHSEKHHEPPPLTPPNRGVLDAIMFQLSKLNWRVVGPAIAIVMALLIAFFIYSAIHNRPAKKTVLTVPTAVYQPPKRTGGDTLPLPTQQPKR